MAERTNSISTLRFEDDQGRGLTEIYKNVTKGRDLKPSQVGCTRRGKWGEKSFRKRRCDGGQTKLELSVDGVTKILPFFI
jgi:hypothetical protein